MKSGASVVSKPPVQRGRREMPSPFGRTSIPASNEQLYSDPGQAGSRQPAHGAPPSHQFTVEHPCRRPSPRRGQPAHRNPHRGPLLASRAPFCSRAPTRAAVALPHARLPTPAPPLSGMSPSSLSTTPASPVCVYPRTKVSFSPPCVSLFEVSVVRWCEWGHARHACPGDLVTL